MNNAPIVKVTLQHTSGMVSPYKPGVALDPMRGGLKEAIVTCFSSSGDLSTRIELLRSDIAGNDWAALEAAGAFPELKTRLQRSASDLLDGHDPHVVVTLTESRGMTDAHLVTSSEAVAAELIDPNKRSLVVPRLLPYQLGGRADGATAVVYSPVAGGGLRLHSLHPTGVEASLAEAYLKQQGETKTGTLQVATEVTRLIALVAAGTFQAAALTTDVDETPKSRATRPHPGLMPSPLAAPTPFAA